MSYMCVAFEDLMWLQPGQGTDDNKVWFISSICIVPSKARGYIVYC